MKLRAVILLMSRCEMVYSVRVDRLLARFLTGLLNELLAELLNRLLAGLLNRSLLLICCEAVRLE